MAAQPRRKSQVWPERRVRPYACTYTRGRALARRARGKTERCRSSNACRMDESWRSCDRAAARFECIASTENCPITAMAHHARRFYGVQFHPEVTHTAQGNTLLARFALDICGARADWVMDDYLNQAIER